MPLKPILTTVEFETLADTLKTEYKLQGDGTYKLDLVGAFLTDKDPAGLLSALENERKEHASTKSKFDSIIQERDAAKKAEELAKATKSGDIEQLKAHFQLQIDEQKKLFEAERQQQKEAIEAQRKAAADQARDAKAMSIATELFGTKAPIMLPHVKARLEGVPGDIPAVQFLDSSGKPDLIGNEETLKQSFLTNDTYADMLVVSNASGGSANGGTKQIPSRTASGQAKRFGDYSPGELSKIRQDNPREYDRLKAERNSS